MTTLTVLPTSDIDKERPCRHRGGRPDPDEPLRPCGSKWLVNNQTVPEEFCRVCPYADVPNPRTRRWQSLWRRLTFRLWRLRRQGWLRRLVADLWHVVRRPWLLPRLARAVAEDAADGFARLEQGEYQRRLETCRRCPGGHFDADAGRCRACGCSAGPGSIYDKLAIPGQRCPHGYWGPHVSSHS
jgi:hypothetical protein